VAFFENKDDWEALSLIAASEMHFTLSELRHAALSLWWFWQISKKQTVRFRV